MRVSAELRTDCSPAPDGEGVTGKTGRGAAPLSRCAAVAFNISAGAGSRVPGGGCTSRGWIENDVCCTAQVFGVGDKGAARDRTGGGEVTVGADGRICSSGSMGSMAVCLARTNAGIGVVRRADRTAGAVTAVAAVVDTGVPGRRVYVGQRPLVSVGVAVEI